MSDFANASEVEIGVVAEASWGVTPSPAAFVPTRFTGESLEISRNNAVSNEIRADRNVADLIQVGGGAAGGVNFELSYSTFDDLLESLMFSTWSGSPANELVNGVTMKSFQLQKKIVATPDVYMLFKGMVVDTMELNVAAEQIVTGSFGFVGKNGTVSEAATGTTGSATTKEVMNASSHLSLSALAISPLPTVLSIRLRVSNGLRAQKQVGSVDAAGIGNGRFTVSGSFEAYFENKSIADMFLAGNSGGLTFTVGGTTAEKYTFNIPTIKLSGNPKIAAGGNDQDIIYSCDFQGLYNTGIDGTMKITRAVA